MRSCKNCHGSVTDDGHGDLVHVIDTGPVTAYAYGCGPGKKGAGYPVAE